MNQWETKQKIKNLGFVLIEFEEGYFSIFTLFHLKQEACTCHMQQDSVK